MPTPLEALVGRIDAAEQRMKIELFDIAEAEAMLRARVRQRGDVVPPGLFDGMLPETRHRVAPILNSTGSAPYTGTT